MKTAIVTKQTWKKKGIDMFEQNVIPSLLEDDQIQAIRYDRSNVYQSSTYHWSLQYAGRFVRGRAIRKNIESNGYDRVFLPSQELLTFDPTSVECQIVPYVHDAFPATTTFSGPIPMLLARQYVQNAGKCDLILCASEQTKTDLRFRTSIDSRIEVVYQGIDPPSVPTDIETEFDLLYVGSMIDRKNPEFLRRCIERALELGYDCTAVLSGLSGESLPCPVRTNVPRKELWKLYAKSKFYLHPSKQEGFGRPPVEAQSVGTPPLALDIPINEEVLGQKHSTWLPIEGVSDVIAALDLSSRRYDELAEQAIKNSNRYEWPTTVSQIKGHLQQEEMH